MSPRFEAGYRRERDTAYTIAKERNGSPRWTCVFRSSVEPDTSSGTQAFRQGWQRDHKTVKGVSGRPCQVEGADNGGMNKESKGK